MLFQGKQLSQFFNFAFLFGCAVNSYRKKFSSRRFFTFEEVSCFNSLYTGGLFHCYMLDASICHLRVYFVAFVEILLANNVGPDQTLHYVASDLGLHCFLVTLLRVSMKQWVSRWMDGWMSRQLYVLFQQNFSQLQVRTM